MQASYTCEEKISMINFPLNKVYLDSVDSTNSYLKRIIKAKGLSSGMAVMANRQTAGRGRLGRTWQSADGNTLCMSIAVKNEHSDGLTLLAALAVFEGLKSLSEAPLQIKWPNDIISHNKKLCGILCERVSEYTVIGIGVNINDEKFGGEIENKATSLYLLSGEKYEVKKVFDVLCASFENVFEKHDFKFTQKAKEDYEGLCANFGKNVVSANFCGEAVGIADDGALLIKTEDGLKAVSSGEVAVHNIY